MTDVRLNQLSARLAGQLGGTTDIMLRPCADGAFLFYMKNELPMAVHLYYTWYTMGDPFTRFTK